MSSRATYITFVRLVLYWLCILFVINHCPVVFSPVYTPRDTRLYSSDILSSIPSISNTGVVEKKTNYTAKKHPSLSLQTRPKTYIPNKNLIHSVQTITYAKAFQKKVLPLTVVFDNLRKEPRGQFSESSLSLVSSLSDWESVTVFTHELGHAIDIEYLKTGADGTDESDIFYTLCWDDYNTKKREVSLKDFVSGYALSNKYEDFAETFVFYVLHNDSFRKKAQKSEILQRKYEFFQNFIFTNEEFEGTDFGTDQKTLSIDYIWDTTKVAIQKNRYLFYVS